MCRAHCDRAQCQIHCTASLGRSVYYFDRVLCYTSDTASSPRCSTCPQTPVCGGNSGTLWINHVISFRMSSVVEKHADELWKWLNQKVLLRVVTFPLCRLNSSPAGPGAVRPGAPLPPASVHRLWELTHNHALSWDAPLKEKIVVRLVILTPVTWHI